MGIPEDEIRFFYLCWMEHLLRVQREGQERARHNGERDADLPKCIDIFDLQGLRFFHLTEFLKIRVLVQIMKLGQDHWPEVLQKAIVVNVPPVGFKMAWSLVQRFCDPDTRAKLTLISGEGRDMLQEVLAAPAKDIDEIFQSVVPFTSFAEMPASLLSGPDFITPTSATSSTAADSSSEHSMGSGDSKGIDETSSIDSDSKGVMAHGCRSRWSDRGITCNPCIAGMSCMRPQLSSLLKMRGDGRVKCR
jgi:hypothetical protein